MGFLKSAGLAVASLSLLLASNALGQDRERAVASYKIGRALIRITAHPGEVRIHVSEWVEHVTLAVSPSKATSFADSSPCLRLEPRRDGHGSHVAFIPRSM